VKILVVEDSKFLRVAVERALAKANFTVILRVRWRFT
jgi:DNA-binding response OmpR family regulator